jgi:hypothetical protein
MAIDSENENFISILLFEVHFCGGDGGDNDKGNNNIIYD